MVTKLGDYRACRVVKKACCAGNKAPITKEELLGIVQIECPSDKIFECSKVIRTCVDNIENK